MNLSVERGEFLCVVGPSGSGKSTLFHILGGLTPATSGTVHIDGRDLSRITDAERTEMRKRMVGFVFQKYNLLPTLSAADNIGIARYLAGKQSARGPEVPRRARTSGHQPPVAPQAAGALGRRAAARRHRPRDRKPPCDSAGRRADGQPGFEELEGGPRSARDLNERLGQTILLITHDMNVAAYGHRVVHMLDGQIVEAPPGE